MHRASKTATIVASILAPIACAATQGPAGESAGAAGSSGMATTTAPTTTSTNTAACALFDAGGAPYGGSLRLYRLTHPAKTSFEMAPNFVAGPVMPASACPGTQVGSCCYYPIPATVPPAGATIGDLDIEDGSRTLFAQTDGGTTGSLEWAPGDAIDITASGGMIAAFSATIVAPAPITGLSPAFGAPTLHLPEGADLVVSWDPSGDACAQIVLGLSTTLPSGPSVFCTVDDSAGTLTAPASLLANFEVSPSVTIERRVVATPLIANADVMLEVADVQYGGTLE